MTHANPLPPAFERILAEVLDNIDADLDTCRAILTETERDVAFLRGEIDRMRAGA